MRGDDYIIESPERIISGKRLRISHIQTRAAKMSRQYGLFQRVLFNSRTPADEDVCAVLLQGL